MGKIPAGIVSAFALTNNPRVYGENKVYADSNGVQTE